MPKDLLFDVILNEIADIVGHEDVTVREAERIAYSMDVYLVSQIWLDGGQKPPSPDWVVFPELTDEISRLLKMASRH